MATTREVQLKITALAEGGNNISELAAKIDALTAEGEQASPAFIKLNEELTQLAQQQALITELNRIRETANATTSELTEAQTKVSTLSATLRDQVAASSEFATAQTNIKEALVKTAVEIKQTNGAIKELKESNRGAARDTDEYKSKIAALIKTVTELNIKQVEQRAEQEKINAAAAVAAKALRTLDSEYKSAERSANTLNSKLSLQNEVLNKAEGELKAAGLASASLADAQAEVASGVSRVTAAYSAAETATRELADEQKKALAVRQAQIEADERFLAAQSAEVAALGRVEQATRAAAAAERAHAESVIATQQAYAKAASEAMKKAFDSTGVRSMEQLDVEAQKVRAALAHIAQEFKAGSISAESFTRAVAGAKVQLAALDKEAKTLPSLPGVFEKISSAVSATISKFAGLGAAVATVGFAVKPVFDLAIQVDSLRRALTTITGSAANAESQLEFLRKTADKSGLSFTGTADSFVKFTASMLSAGISSEETQKIFAATANAAGNLGLTGARTSLVFDAMGQMASKGVVSMEELRQQLGESLPGSLGIMAKGLGITQAELVKLVESGKLLATDALPALARELQRLGATDGQVKGLGASFALLENAIKKAIQSATDSAGFKSLAGIIADVAKNFSTLVDITVGFGKALLAIKLVNAIAAFASFGNATRAAAVDLKAATVATEVNTVATAANTVTTVTNTTVKNTASLASRGLATAVGLATAAKVTATAAASRLGAVMGGLPGILLAVILNYKELGTWIGESVAKMTKAGRAVEDYDKQVKASSEAAAAAAAKAAAAQQLVSESAVQMGVAYAKALPGIEANLKSAIRMAEAKKIEGESLVRIAELSGSELDRLLASASASEKNAIATRSAADAKQQELTLMANYIDGLERIVAAKNGGTEAEIKLIETSKEKLKVLTAESVQMKVAADSEAQHAVALKTSAEAYADNAGRVGELKEAFLNAQAALNIMTTAAKEGTVAEGALARAAENAAKAQNLYRDAIADSVTQAARMKDGAAFMNQVLGESKDTLEGSAAAAKNYADKMAESTELLREQIRVLKEAVAANKAAAEAHGDASGKLAAERVELGKLITAKQQEVEASRRATAASKDDAAAKQIAAAAYKDNANAVGTYSGNVKIAQEELRRMIEAQKEGKATAEDVADATRNVATAMALYKDALKDVTTNIQNQIQLEKAYATQMAASNKLDMERQKTIEAVARAKGDESAVTESLIRQKEIERTSRANNANSMAREAEAEIDLANAYRNELASTGQLTPEKENEIKVRIANAEAKQTEAAATGETVNQINSEINALKNLAAQKKVNQQVDKDGFVLASNGQRLEMAAQNDPKAPATLRSDGRWNYTGKDGQWRISNRMPIQGKDGSWIDPDGVAGFAEPEGGGTNATLGGGSGGGLNPNPFGSSKSGTGPGASATSSTSTTNGTSSTHTVTINLGGTSKNINVASETDGLALTEMLKRLLSDMKRN